MTPLHTGSPLFNAPNISEIADAAGADIRREVLERFAAAAAGGSSGLPDRLNVTARRRAGIAVQNTINRRITALDGAKLVDRADGPQDRGDPVT